MCVVANRIAGCFVVPRLHGIGDRNADALAKVFESFFGDLGKTAGSKLGRRRHSTTPGISSGSLRWRLRARAEPCGELFRLAFWGARSRRRCGEEIRAG